MIFIHIDSTERCVTLLMSNVYVGFRECGRLTGSWSAVDPVVTPVQRPPPSWLTLLFLGWLLRLAIKWWPLKVEYYSYRVNYDMGCEVMLNT
jgi:hypothetical protein